MEDSLGKGEGVEQSREDESRKGGLWLRGPQGIRRPGLEDLPLKGLRELGPA